MSSSNHSIRNKTQSLIDAEFIKTNFKYGYGIRNEGTKEVEYSYFLGLAFITYYDGLVKRFINSTINASDMLGLMDNLLTKC